MANAAGPESLEDYFQKGALLGWSKRGNKSLVRRYQAKLWRRKKLPIIEGLSYLAYKITKFFFDEFYKPKMTDLQIFGNSFCKFGLVSTYQRFSATLWPKSSPSKDSGPSAAMVQGRQLPIAQLHIHVCTHMYTFAHFIMCIFKQK